MTVAVCFFKAGTTMAAGPAMLRHLRAKPQRNANVEIQGDANCIGVFGWMFVRNVKTTLARP